MAANDIPTGFDIKCAPGFTVSAKPHHDSDNNSTGGGGRTAIVTRILEVFENLEYAQKTTTDVGTIMTFYDTTLDRGVEACNAVHPISGNVVEVQFMKRPTYERVGPNNYTIKFALEEV